MNKEIRTLWVTELRRGLPQDNAGLKGLDGFSALGVLVDLYIRDTGLGKWENRINISETVVAETPRYRLVNNLHNIKDDPYPETFAKPETNFSGLRDRVINDVENMLLPKEVVEWAGLEDNVVTYIPHNTIAEFKGNHIEAADAIEENL